MEQLIKRQMVACPFCGEDIPLSNEKRAALVRHVVVAVGDHFTIVCPKINTRKPCSVARVSRFIRAEVTIHVE